MNLRRILRTKRGRRRANALILGIAASVYACLIFYFSAQSTTPETVDPIFLSSDKLAHVAEFALLGALLFLTFAHADWRPWDAPLAVVLGVVYGAADEFHQLYVPGRAADPVDALLDAIGVVLAVVVLAYTDRRLHPTIRRPNIRKA